MPASKITRKYIVSYIWEVHGRPRILLVYTQIWRVFGNFVKLEGLLSSFPYIIFKDQSNNDTWQT